MKTSTYKYFLLFGLVGFLIACSTKKNKFINRNYHAVTTEYNVLYNGNLALDAGVNELKTTYNDNFWELLPVERMQLTEEEMTPNDKRNPNFERAEEKATKAIQKHSMYMGGSEKNPQIDEAHLLLGQSRYYDNRYIPALEAFNYILYKYPNSDKIGEAKVWRAKTNIRLESEGTAIKNLKLLLEGKTKLSDQVYADANAILAEAYIKTEYLDSALVVLKKAAEYTTQKEERARYYFITGQLYQRLNYPDSAFAAFQQVIDMKRKSPRRYVIQAHAQQAAQFDYKNGDTLVFMEKYNDLLKDRENRPYLDVINHQVGLFYDKQNLDENAVKYYNKSLRAKTDSKDPYLKASNYRNIAEINFEKAKYPVAGLYYDSTMVYLDKRSREFKNIKKKRDNLEDVIKYEAIARVNDSILHVVSLSDEAKKEYYQDYIEILKEKEAAERERLEKEARRQENMAASGAIQPMQPALGSDSPMKFDPSISKEKVKNPLNQSGSINAPGQLGSGATPGKFYFYTPSTVSYGKLEFARRWGKRPLADNWRWASDLRNVAAEQGADADSLSVESKNEDELDPRFTPEFYITQLPTSQKVLDSLAKERNFAYYQLGTIYKEKFKEYQRAADKLEKLLQNNPEERLVLPSKYNLYKIYQIINPERAELYKQQILAEYPDSRYAEIIRNPTLDAEDNQSPEAVYATLFKKYENGEIRESDALVREYIDRYTGEPIVSKFELLKAGIDGRLEGVEEYKKTLNFVALNYPNSEEGKKAEVILKTDIPALEKLAFGEPAMSWKIVFKFDNPNDPKIKPLTEKIQKYMKEGLNNNITLSQDIYTTGSDFLVIHGFSSKLAAEDAVSVLKDYKKYKIAETPIIISSEDYKVVQIKKNFTEYSAVK
ncbi:tetratricopeptide repeat protein [Flavobacterium salilacus subsp. salilacus]|uniref:type IX secretion system periplasmic lipoprotein PorW/SprE n=1 Tax=Flavobacterium TaxID=237 RepID=UPI001074D00F|nr:MULTISPECIES: tetratricopeptide repeat protein [Flavobacterium]KAF2518967.1 tetratricopeptide repeat protein [Flavobacterium salilacus subsp. salilacus]MBE1614871.1 tetratricopeptide repeat protein [Flavobacterium sp. SaA2.13]